MVWGRSPWGFMRILFSIGIVSFDGYRLLVECAIQVVLAIQAVVLVAVGVNRKKRGCVVGIIPNRAAPFDSD